MDLHLHSYENFLMLSNSKILLQQGMFYTVYFSINYNFVGGSHNTFIITYTIAYFFCMWFKLDFGGGHFLFLCVLTAGKYYLRAVGCIGFAMVLNSLKFFSCQRWVVILQKLHTQKQTQLCDTPCPPQQMNSPNYHHNAIVNGVCCLPLWYVTSMHNEHIAEFYGTILEQLQNSNDEKSIICYCFSVGILFRKLQSR